MYFLYISLVFVGFFEQIFAASYNQQCSTNTNCNLPGLICYNDRCVCNWKLNLFWTNARCLLCPNDWMRTETRCVVYVGTQLTWVQARTACADMQSELLSYRNDSTVSLIYQLTATTHHRKRRTNTASDKSVVWTSGHAVELESHSHSPSDLYQWLDKSLPAFNTKSIWWCKKGMTGFAFYYQFDEPTRLIQSGVLEKCLLSRRGTTGTMVICLDDVLCEEKYPFICEKSESTAQSYVGPPPSSSGSSTGDSGGADSSSSINGTSSSSVSADNSSAAGTSSTDSSGGSSSAGNASSSSGSGGSSSAGNASSSSGSGGSSSTSTVPSISSSGGSNSASVGPNSSSSSGNHPGGGSGGGGSIVNSNSSVHYDHHEEITSSSQSLAAEPDESHTTTIVLVVFGFLLLVGIVIGVFFFMKCRKAGNTQTINLNEKNQTKFDPPPPPAPRPDPKPVIINDADAFKPQHSQSEDNGLALNIGTPPENIGFNIGNQKQQKNKKGGYSKQQFVDELE